MTSKLNAMLPCALLLCAGFSFAACSTAPSAELDRAVPSNAAHPAASTATVSPSMSFVDSVSGPVVQVQQTGSGQALAATASTGTAVFGQMNGTSGNAILGSAASPSGATIALMGLNASSSGTGVLGNASALSGPSFGVRGLSASTLGTGLWGFASAQAGQTIGLRGDVQSPSGLALYGRSAAATGNTYGLWAESVSTGGTAAMAVSLASSGTTIGLRGEARSPQGVAAVFDNVVGGQILSARVNGLEKLRVDGQGNLLSAGSISGANVAGNTLTIRGGTDLFEWMTSPGTGGSSLSLLHGATSSAASPTGLSINSDGSINFALNQKFPNGTATEAGELVLATASTTASQVAFAPDSSDSVHSYIGQTGNQYHLRLSRAAPDGTGAKDLLIGPYNFGMGFEYPGTLEFWSQDFSVHMNHQTGDPNLPANFWVGDEQDFGGLYATAHWNQGPNATVVLAADKFDHSSHGSLSLQVRDPKDSFLFQSGPWMNEVTRAQISSTATGNLLEIFAGATTAVLRADSSAGVRLSSSAGSAVAIGSGAATGLAIYPSGNVGIAGAPDAAALAVGTLAGFQVSSAGAVLIGGGTQIKQHLSVQANLSFGTFAALACQELAIPVPGASDGDTAALGVPSALASLPGLNWSGYVSQPNVVAVRGCNATASPVSSPGAAMVRADVWKH